MRIYIKRDGHLAVQPVDPRDFQAHRVECGCQLANMRGGLSAIFIDPVIKLLEQRAAE